MKHADTVEWLWIVVLLIAVLFATTTSMPNWLLHHLQIPHWRAFP